MIENCRRYSEKVQTRSTMLGHDERVIILSNR